MPLLRRIIWQNFSRTIRNAHTKVCYADGIKTITMCDGKTRWDQLHWKYLSYMLLQFKTSTEILYQ